MKTYELRFENLWIKNWELGSAGFEKIKVGFSWDNLFSRESNVWYPSVTLSVQHFTKGSWNLQSFSICSKKFLCVMLWYANWRSEFYFDILITVTHPHVNHKKFFSIVYLAQFITKFLIFVDFYFSHTLFGSIWSYPNL